MSFLAGPKGIKAGDELTFFYPSSEWAMAQAFDCFCGSSDCRGRIDGAGKMTLKQLEGLWLNGYIREMLAEREQFEKANAKTNGSGATAGPRGVTSRELGGEMGGDTVAA